MKLSVFTFWTSGGAVYHIEDQETHDLDLVDIAFDSKENAQAYLDTHRDEIEREVEQRKRAPLSSEEVTQLWALLAHIEKGLDAGDLPIDIYGGRAKVLTKLGRQPVPLDPAASERLESVIARLNGLAEGSAHAAAKARLEGQEAETKLDLARCYLEMGDTEGALILLDEIEGRGDDAYKKRAREIVKVISGQTREG